MTASRRADDRRRRVGRGLVVVVLTSVVGWAFVSPKPSRTTEIHPVEIVARRIVSFDPKRPGVRGFGKLDFRGGLHLTSNARTFGGWSALALSADGSRLLSVSDSGVWLTAGLVYDGDHPAGLVDARLGPLLDPAGEPLSRGRDRDSEGLAIVAGTLASGEALVSFEQNHRVGRFPVSAEGLGPMRELLALPSEVRHLPFNKSLESVCLMQDGSPAGAFVVLAERYPTPDAGHLGWMRSGGGWRTLQLRNLDGYDLTDCHGLADGGMLVLERRFRWRDMIGGVRMRLRHVSAAEIASGQPLTGEVLIEAGGGEETDNMEGLAVHRDRRGEIVVTLISDDNFNRFLQRTLLLQFAWKREPVTPTPAAARK